MSESRILVRLLRMYFPRNWEFGSALSKLHNFEGGGFEPPNPPRFATERNHEKLLPLTILPLDPQLHDPFTVSLKQTNQFASHHIFFQPISHSLNEVVGHAAGNPRVENPVDIYDTATEPEVTQCPTVHLSSKHQRICTARAIAVLRKAFLTEGKVKKNINCNNTSQQVMNWALGREAWAERWKRKVR